jgi:hypothetical protein
MFILNRIQQIGGSVMIVIVWELDLQLPVQSVPIITNVVSLNPVYGEVFLIQHYVIKFVRNNDNWLKIIVISLSFYDLHSKFKQLFFRYLQYATEIISYYCTQTKKPST